MKTWICLLPFLTLLSCGQEQVDASQKATSATKNSTATPKISEAEYKKDIRYSDSQLESFLDSVGRLPTQPIMLKRMAWTDSAFRSQVEFNRILTTDEFAEVKQAARLGKMDTITAKRIFGDNKFSAFNDAAGCYKALFVPVACYSFDTNKRDFNEYALLIGGQHCHDSKLFFLKANKIIARRNSYQHYGLELSYGKAADGQAIVYYPNYFASGSGEWWNNLFFYKYDGDKLLPVLNELGNGNEQGFPTARWLWLEAFVQKTNPLTIKMVYNVSLAAGASPAAARTMSTNRQMILNDSTIVRYVWNQQEKRFEGQYSESKITKPQVWSYTTGNSDLLFINSYYPALKKALHDKAIRRQLMDYLNETRNLQNYANPENKSKTLLDDE